MDQDQSLSEALPIHHISRPLFFSFFFKILKFQFFTFFLFFSFSLTWDPIDGSQHCKLLLLPQIAPEFSQTSREYFCLQYPHKVTFSDFLNSEVLNFNHFFSFPLTWDHRVGKF